MLDLALITININEKFSYLAKISQSMNASTKVSLFQDFIDK
jgi:hypothetical protein